MASPLVFKIYNRDKELVASTRHAEDAASIVALHGEGARITWYGRLVWKEGNESGFQAGDSYDYVAGHIHQRIREINQRAAARQVARLG